MEKIGEIVRTSDGRTFMKYPNGSYKEIKKKKRGWKEIEADMRSFDARFK